MRSTAPCLSRLTLPRMKASGLARSSAIIARSRLTWLPRATTLAICDKVCPRWTITLPSAAGAAAGAATARGRAGAGAGVVAVDGAGALTLSAAAGAGAASRAMVLESVPAGATISGSATASALDGASTSAEYSRTRRPWPQSASIRKLSDGVSTGVCEVTRTTALPCALRVSSNCSSPTRPVGRCRPTRSKVTGEANATRRFSSSDGSAETTGISASRGWPGLDRTRMSPKPRASAELLARASSAVER